MLSMEFPNTLPHSPTPRVPPITPAVGDPSPWHRSICQNRSERGAAQRHHLRPIEPATCLVVSALSYAVGRGLDPEMAFLDPRRAPTGNEAAIAQAIGYGLRSMR